MLDKPNANQVIQDYPTTGIEEELDEPPPLDDMSEELAKRFGKINLPGELSARSGTKRH